MEQFCVEGLQHEQDHRSLLRDIDERQNETKSQAEDYENQASTISEILDQIKTGLWCNFFFLKHIQVKV